MRYDRQVRVIEYLSHDPAHDPQLRVDPSAPKNNRDYLRVETEEAAT